MLEFCQDYLGPFKKIKATNIRKKNRKMITLMELLEFFLTSIKPRLFLA